MYTFLVLGQIPGTNIQISFQVWLVILAGLVLAVMAFTLSLRVRRAFKRQAMRLRQPLSASQLHQQAQ